MFAEESVFRRVSTRLPEGFEANARAARAMQRRLRTRDEPASYGQIGQPKAV